MFPPKISILPPANKQQLFNFSKLLINYVCFPILVYGCLEAEINTNMASMQNAALRPRGRIWQRLEEEGMRVLRKTHTIITTENKEYKNRLYTQARK